MWRRLRAALTTPTTPPSESVDAPHRWIAVGLTNPEAEYAGTRHNVGADVVRALAARLGGTLKPHKAQALVADVVLPVAGERVPLTLAVPFGYMNTSGGPVQRIAAFYKVPPERIIVVHDELDLEPGVVRLRRGGAGGHNGVRSVKQRLGSDDYLRVRVGIGRPPGRMDPAKYVLKPFSTAERRDVIDVAVQEAAEAIELLVAHGLEGAQNRIH